MVFNQPDLGCPERHERKPHEDIRSMIQTRSVYAWVCAPHIECLI
jgi:hypothetical protein